MICTAHNLVSCSPSQRPPEPPTVQQMPGRDAYLDGLLAYEIMTIQKEMREILLAAG